MNKGTCEGTKEEIRFIQLMNGKKKINFWRKMGLNQQDSYAIHVVEHKFGHINNKKVKPKADVFFCKGGIPEEYIREKGGYLNENDSAKFGLEPIKFSGVSVKQRESDRYQILKMNPPTFKKIFGSFELGAGASIYCSKKEELKKNNSVLRGWKTDWKSSEKFFNNIKHVEALKNEKKEPEERLSVSKEIKKFSNKTITELIKTKKKISRFVFQGIGNFKEPFNAHWIYAHGKLQKLEYIPFVVTTGSGRGRGDFTVVIKPK